MNEYNMRYTGAELDEAISRVMNGEHNSEYYTSSFNNSATTQNMSFDVGFKPKLFVILTMNGFAGDNSSATPIYYISCIWHVSDVTGNNGGEYTGGLSVYNNQQISYGANNYYGYSNGVVTINDTVHCFKSNILYRVFAMA